MQDPIDNSTVYWRVILDKYSNYYYYIISRVRSLFWYAAYIWKRELEYFSWKLSVPCEIMRQALWEMYFFFLRVQLQIDFKWRVFMVSCWTIEMNYLKFVIFGLYLQGLNVSFNESSIQLPSEAFRSRDSHVVSVIYLTLNYVISLRKGKSENTSILPNTTVVSSTVFPPPQKNFIEPVKIVLQNKRVCWTVLL